MKDAGKRKDIDKESSESVRELATRMILSTIPILGGPALELFNFAVASPLEKRRVDWMNDVAQRLVDLEKERDFNIKNLENDPEFTSILLQTSQMALRTHQEEKLNALKNVVINTAKKIDIEENTKYILLSLVDNFTPLHINILNHLRSRRFISRVETEYLNYFNNLSRSYSGQEYLFQYKKIISITIYNEVGGNVNYSTALDLKAVNIITFVFEDLLKKGFLEIITNNVKNSFSIQYTSLGEELIRLIFTNVDSSSILVDDVRRFLWDSNGKSILDLTGIVKGVMALEDIELYIMEDNVGRATTKIDLGIDPYEME